MFSRTEIKHIHMELSSMCNARCPLCPRNFFGFPHNCGFNETNLKLEKLKEILPADVIQGVEEILINGNYGDFVMNPESVDIISWIREIAPDVKIHISTNGGARDQKFWERLAQLDLEVSFCIDGLDDTHEIYRQDTRYDIVIKNAKSYINAGGRAVWTMTEFDHNKHQFAEAEERSEKLGFGAFIKRSTGRDSGPVYNRDGKKIFKLKQIDRGLPDVITDEYAQNFSGSRQKHPWKSSQSVAIDCESKRNRSIYISVEGHITPCCFTGLYKTEPHFYTGIPELLTCQHLDQSLEYFKDIEKTFNETQLIVCQTFCKVRNKS